MNTLGIWLAEQESFALMIGRGDAAGLSRSLAPLTRDNLISSTVVTDQEGVVLSRTRGGEQLTSGDNIRNLPGVSEALAGQSTTGTILDSSGRLERFSAMPVYRAEQKLPVGVLVLGVTMDYGFVASLSKKIDKEVAILYEDRLALSTMASQGAPRSIQALPAPVAKAANQGRPSDFVVLNFAGDDYLFKFSPMGGSDGASEAMYGVGVPTDTISSARLVLFKTYALGLVFIGLALAFFGILFTRAVVVPAHKLLAATRQMTTGDLSSSINLGRRDELGELAESLDCARQNFERNLRVIASENERLVAIVDSMGVAAIITDHNHRIVGVNHAAQMLLGTGQSSLLGQLFHSLFVLIPTSDATMPALWNALPGAAGGDQKLFSRARFPLHENPKTVVEILSSQIETSTSPTGYVHLLQDVSAHEQSTRAKDDFIINLAHELRSPLASLRTSIELILEDYAVMSKRDLGVMLRSLQKSSIKFQTLVENLIEVGNIQASRFRVKPVPTTLDGVIRDAVNHMNPLLKAKGQRLELKLEAEPKLVVMADRRRVLQVLINLITNASKYGPEDEAIGLSSCRDGGFVFLGVTDRGPGIPLEEQDGLFQRFYRTKLAEEEGTGIGLGLALTKEIIEAHGGTVGLTSALGQGTTFWFSLPEGPTQEPGLPQQGREGIRSVYESSVGGRRP